MYRRLQAAPWPDIPQALPASRRGRCACLSQSEPVSRYSCDTEFAGTQRKPPAALAQAAGG
ncbi:hypothetical protein CBM2623_A130007 [Cupriavidus taiwanensis]|nr:hypothetical protein CBM2623_A130007 [Cupriavidus taiwanensis]